MYQFWKTLTETHLSSTADDAVHCWWFLELELNVILKFHLFYPWLYLENDITVRLNGCFNNSRA